MKPYIIYIIAVISGLLGVLAFSPFDYWGLAYVSLFGLIYIAKTPKKSTALWATFLWGISFFGFGVNWLNVSIHQFGGASLIVSYFLVGLLAAYLSLYPLLFTYLIQRFQVKSAVIFPVIWTFTEFLRGWLFTGFPWLQFGYSQIDSPFAGIAPIFGVTGLTFFTMWGSAVIFGIVFEGRRSTAPGKFIVAYLAQLIVISGLSAYIGKVKFVTSVEDRGLMITLAQGNIEQNLKWDPDYFYSTLAVYQKLISDNLGKTDLIILPESALPTLENHILPFLENLDQVGRQYKTEVMIGTVFQEDQSGKLFNSIIALGGDKSYTLNTPNRYNKHHLVPFGEYVPLEQVLRPLGSVFNLPMSAFQQGEAVQPSFMAKQRAFTPAICYEIIFGEQVRQNIKKQTDYLLTVSNDAWFGNSIGPWQHLQMARMRALELGKPLIRATNTGISVFINERGGIMAQAPQFEQTTLTHKIVPTEGKTPYSVLGNIPLYFLSALFVILRGLNHVIRRKLNLVKNT
ncbi:apolipoprotein N-acyltransferase [Rodentibacter caecimuris]|uniref:Apolipoprotein N-acyltransferase n=1 Tax=Rodentibacter caecimuris TaxID=1796644 RepID=A0ABX3KYV7_9PAST|nr:apolipoprotein N-acyltransferase [Rodentibacter heylii]